MNNRRTQLVYKVFNLFVKDSNAAFVLLSDLSKKKKKKNFSKKKKKLFERKKKTVNKRDSNECLKEFRLYSRVKDKRKTS